VKYLLGANFEHGHETSRRVRLRPESFGMSRYGTQIGKLLELDYSGRLSKVFVLSAGLPIIPDISHPRPWCIPPPDPPPSS
jgi:hypothetical protein